MEKADHEIPRDVLGELEWETLSGGDMGNTPRSHRAVDAARIDEFVDFVVAAAEAGDGVFGPRADILATLMELLGVSPDPRAPPDRWGLRRSWRAALAPWGEGAGAESRPPAASGDFLDGRPRPSPDRTGRTRRTAIG
jgi:hypothetical protein